MKRTDFRFLDRQRVRWVDVDMQKIVFNGHYLAYLDTAMAGYWRALALPYQATMAAMDGDLFVRKASLDYHAPAEYDDVLNVGLRCERIGTSSLRYLGAVFRGDALLVGAELVYVFADPADRRSRPVPTPLRDLILGFEAGQAVFDVRVGSWDALGEQARALRLAVFVEEQHVPAEMELDDADPHCLHAVACNRLGMPLATGRLMAYRPGVSKIGRMAVSRTLRGSQIGRAVLDALITQALQRGDREVLLHAQLSAVGFYQRAGFQSRGDRFEEAGILHIEMALGLV